MTLHDANVVQHSLEYKTDSFSHILIWTKTVGTNSRYTRHHTRTNKTAKYLFQFNNEDKIKNIYIVH